MKSKCHKFSKHFKAKVAIEERYTLAKYYMSVTENHK